MSRNEGCWFLDRPPAAMKIMVGYAWGHIILGGECSTLDLAEVFSFADDGHPKNHAASIIEFLSLLRWVHFVGTIFTLAAGPVVIIEANNSTDPFHYVKPELGRNLGDNVPKLCILAVAFMEMQKHSIIGLQASHFRTYSNTASKILCHEQQSHIFSLYGFIVITHIIHIALSHI